MFGVLLSAAIALSSTTFLGNLLAGLMLRSVRNFRLGDFVRCGEHFGRVTERGLFHTEIQTEERDLTTLANIFLVTHPVTVLRSSGTLVSATVSLGYDVPRTRVETLLVAAAGAAGLHEPHVRIIELGDFSVTYRVIGLLTEVKTLLTTRSRLRGEMMDHLHQGGVEIVSPTFRNVRTLPVEEPIIPERERVLHEPDHGVGLEGVAFDKAELAQSVDDLERARAALEAERTQLAQRIAKTKDEAERAVLKAEKERVELRLARSEKVVQRRVDELAEKDDPAAS